MKLTLTFFLFLFLLGGNGRADAKSHKGNICFATARDIEKAQVNTSQGCVITRDDGLRQENPFLISVEYEDEETLIRKHIQVSFTGCFACLSDAFISCLRDTCPSDCLSFREHQSRPGACKYIAQRVLRI